MKKLLLPALIFSLLYSIASNATIRRVGYTGPKVSGVDYADVNAAVQAAANGDTIQLYQNANTGSAVVNKQLFFFGFGYLLNVNANLQAVPGITDNVDLHFREGSENSKVQGVAGTFYIGVDNITLSRCTGSVYLGYNSSIGAVAISSPVIVSSYINFNGPYGAVSNALISNCIIPSSSQQNVAGLVSNNIFTAYMSAFGACVVKNNIIAQGYCPAGASAVFQNNVFNVSAGSCTFTGTGNKFSINPTDVFTDWTAYANGATSESNLTLKAGSPAINAGIGNNGQPTNAGIYGGDAGLVYKLSGIPPIPSVYKLSAPTLSTSTGTYTISASVRSNN